MKCLYVVLLCLAPAISTQLVGYPSSINMQKDVIGFLALSGRKIFCNLILITHDKGIAASTCFAGIDRNTEQIYALTDELRYSERKLSRVLKVIPGNEVEELMQPQLAVIMVQREKRLKSENLVKGIFPDDDYCLTDVNNSLLIYGYSKINSEPMAYLKATLKNFDAGYFHFCLHCKPTEINLRGAPVFYKKALLAICERDTDDEFISCIDARHFSREVFLSFIKESAITLRQLSKNFEDDGRPIPKLNLSNNESQKLSETVVDTLDDLSYPVEYLKYTNIFMKLLNQDSI